MASLSKHYNYFSLTAIGDDAYFTACKVLGRCNPEHSGLRLEDEQPNEQVLREILEELTNTDDPTPLYTMLVAATDFADKVNKSRGLAEL